MGPLDSADSGATLDLPRSPALDRPAHRSTGPLVGIRGLIAVGDNVLYDATLWRRWLWQLLGHFRVEQPFERFFERWDAEYLPQVCIGRRDFGEAFAAFLGEQGLTLAEIDEIEAASSARRRQLAEQTRLLPSVASTLRKLSDAGLALAVVNNCDDPRFTVNERLEATCARLPLMCALSSQRMESALPHPPILRASVEALDLEAEQVALLAADAPTLATGLELGLASIGMHVTADTPATRRIERIEDLLPLLAGATD